MKSAAKEGCVGKTAGIAVKASWTLNRARDKYSNILLTPLFHILLTVLLPVRKYRIQSLGYSFYPRFV